MFASEVSRVSTTLTGRKEQGRSLTEVKDREMGWIFRSWGIKLFIEKRERMYSKVSIKSHETLNRAINRKGRGLGSLAGLGNGEKTGRSCSEEGQKLARRDRERIWGGDARQRQPTSPVPSPGKAGSGQEGARGGASLPGDPGGGSGQVQPRGGRRSPPPYLRASPGR